MDYEMLYAELVKKYNEKCEALDKANKLIMETIEYLKPLIELRA